MIERLLRASVGDIPPYVPGRSKEEVAKDYGLDPEKIIKMASNENPLGPSPRAVAAIKDAANQTAVYPTADAAVLRDALAEHLGMDRNHIIAGNGSDEILDMAVKIFLDQGDEAVISIPTFSMYSALTLLYGGKPVYVPMTGDFEYDLEAIRNAINDKTKMVFVCSPNNPTGSCISRSSLKELLDYDVIVVVDEAYVEFSDGSFEDLVKDHENLLITRTFSKAYGLAGMRVGYGISNPKLIAYMLRIKIPFSVNLLAEKAAVSALSDGVYLGRSVDLVEEGRVYLEDELAKVPGLLAYPSKANFILVNTKGTKKTGAEVAGEMFERGIIIRDCASFNGLDEYHFRVSVGTMEENRRFVEELKAIV